MKLIHGHMAVRESYADIYHGLYWFRLSSARLKCLPGSWRQAACCEEARPGCDLVVAPLTGTIHQAEAVPGSHSLHLTVSTGQRRTLADLLETALPRALALAAEECVFLRKALPFDVFDHLVREPLASISRAHPDARPEPVEASPSVITAGCLFAYRCILLLLLRLVMCV